jgi:hypothetical protein
MKKTENPHQAALLKRTRDARGTAEGNGAIDSTNAARGGNDAVVAY